MARSFLIGLFGLSLCVSISATQILFGLLLLEALISRRLVGRPQVLWPFLFFVIWMNASTILTGQTLSIRALSSQSAILFYFLLATTFKTQETKKLILWFCVSAVFSGCWGLIQKLSGVEHLTNQPMLQIPAIMTTWPNSFVELLAVYNGRAVGTRSHPLTYAESLMPACFILMAGFVQKGADRDWKKGMLVLLGFLGVLGGVMVSESRGVLLGILFGSLIFGGLLGRRAFFVTLLFVVVGIFLSFAFSPKLRGRILSVVSNQQGSLSDQQSKGTRYVLWTSAVSQISEKPIVGYGAGGVHLQTIDPIEKKPRFWSETHNIFLQIGLESGLVGLGLFLWLLVSVCQMAGGLFETYRAAFISCFMAFMVAGLTESWVNDKEIAMLFWTLIGCADVFSRGSREES